MIVKQVLSFHKDPRSSSRQEYNLLRDFWRYYNVTTTIESEDEYYNKVTIEYEENVKNKYLIIQDKILTIDRVFDNTQDGLEELRRFLGMPYKNAGNIDDLIK